MYNLLMKSLVQSVKRTIDKYGMLEGGETVLVSVSGGPDSLALLYILRELSTDYGIDLHIFHLNHLMRGEAAEADAVFVEETAKKLGVPTTVMTADVPAYIAENDVSPEDGARRVRRALLAQIAGETGADKIAVGHTADDRVETYLMRIIRGAGLDGLKSIQPVTGDIIRPLIAATRAEIMDYCAAEDLQPREDETNEDTSILRNKIRHELIPLLAGNYNRAFRDEALREIAAIEGDLEVIEAATRQAWDEATQGETKSEVRFDREIFAALKPGIRRRLIRLAAEKLAGTPQLLTFSHVEDIIDKVVFGASGAALDLPLGLSASREYDTILVRSADGLSADKTVDFTPRALCIPGLTRLDELDVTIDARFGAPDEMDAGAGEGVAFLDADLLEGNIQVRPVKSGDRFRPLGLKGTKKLSDLLIDEKVTRELRRRTPIVETEGEIVWVAGIRIDDRYKVTGRTKKTLILKLLRGSS